MRSMIKAAQYFKVRTPNKAGVGFQILNELRRSGVDLMAFSGFPRAGGAQLDFVPANAAKFLAAAKKANLAVSRPKTCFVVQGQDRPGAVANVLVRLADAKINVTAVDAATGGGGRYGAMLWVKDRDVKKAAKVLGAK